MNHIVTSILLIPVYGLMGYLLSRSVRGFLSLPWYLTQKQFLGLSFSAMSLAIGWYICRLTQIYLTHKPPGDSLVGLAQLSIWYVGYMIPFYFYRQKQLQNEEYIATLTKKTSATFGWEIPQELLNHPHLGDKDAAK